MELLSDPRFTAVIERHSARITNPMERLRFVRACSEALSGQIAWIDNRIVRDTLGHYVVLDCLAGAVPGLREGLSVSERFGIGAVRLLSKLPASNPVWRFRKGIGLAFGFTLLLTVGVATSPSPTTSERNLAAGISRAQQATLAFEAEQGSLDIWKVQQEGETELYSNGLRVSNAHRVSHEPRSYPVYSAQTGKQLFDGKWRSEPVGIIYHTTVSEVSPPLEEENNDLIRLRGKNLLDFVARDKLYNFVIDRFGRVYRIIAENEMAFHSGFSIWADDTHAYLNLNHSFIGVAFETRPEAVDPGAPPEKGITPAQLTSARLLTRMLRAEYGIAPRNCVTHEMVSVNPDKMLIGYHTDFAGRFPFAAVGLGKNYDLTLSSIAQWGFSYDTDFVAIVGGRPWEGMRRAQSKLNQDADAHDMTVAEYRKKLRRAYHKTLNEIRAGSKRRPGA